jgi:hypothetical protein
VIPAPTSAWQAQLETRFVGDPVWEEGKGQLLQLSLTEDGFDVGFVMLALFIEHDRALPSVKQIRDWMTEAADSPDSVRSYGTVRQHRETVLDAQLAVFAGARAPTRGRPRAGV